MAFKSFVGNSGPVEPPKKPISFGLSEQSPPRSSNIPRRTFPSPPRSQPKSGNSPSPPRESLKPRPRARSSSPTPPLLHDDEQQRETEAKARRLARFNTELSNPIRSSSPPLGRQKHQQENPSQKKEVDETMDYEDSEPILGSCPDMCPESERGERERKGDLDKFERLHGDRNLTDKSLAVKKYNRTAEREASLIRPLRVLQSTMDHILTLIDRSYDDDVLSIYNFLWDRMRAIRMDLRIQHIFDQDAITMHEKMIRFHIVAMHELCEYTKGEGFSEGFDAHLNIEQMNKASVDLFQMYDDHRKRGCPISTEQEFRGYYALLKLDKHPGYKVEPAELSLDLAKMTSEMRNTKEVLFAREVARASRSGNYIAFFRLARKATYLQACLMHAHFAKLRTQALASLHSGLQKNQGIPVAEVVKWLAMEREDTEGLFDYHGFSLKQFEDLYVVKEGPFLNGDVDFPTKRSQLVHQKRSAKILHDVISPGQLPVMDGTLQSFRSLDAENKISNKAKYPNVPAFNFTVPPEEEMPDYEEDVLPIDAEKIKYWDMQEPFQSQQTRKCEGADKQEIRPPIPKFGGESVVSRSGARKHTIHRSKPVQEQKVKKLRRNIPEPDVEIKMTSVPLKEQYENVMEREEALGPVVHNVSEMHRIEAVKDWTAIEPNDQDEKAKLALWKAEIDAAKLKLLLRRWKRQASKNIESRHMRRLKADAALNSLLVGPPVRSNKKIGCQEEHLGGIQNLSRVELNIDQIVRERYNMHTRMWSKLDVPEIIAPILSQKNPEATCLCWKLVLCSRINDKSCTNTSQIVGKWLRSKMMDNGTIDREQLSISISEVVASEHSDTSRLFCLSILRDVSLVVDRLEIEEASLGASGLLFILVDKVHLDFERARLQALVGSVKPSSCLPLLILSSVNVEASTIENQLELQKLDRTRISGWSVIFVTENEHDNAKEFLSDDCLRKGLLWLAVHAPPQPYVYSSDVRDLVLESLEPYMNVLLNANPLKVTPAHCICAFNQALNETENDIVLAAQKSLPGWPAPEIKDLEVRVGGYLDSYLPKSGWNMGCNIDAIVHALRLCKLPEISSFNLDPISCGVGSQEFGDEIQEQKLTLQKYLNQYLCQIGFASKGDLLTLKEADLMAQNHTVCECIDSKHVIVPEWATIFRRIYNWQLMLLESEPAAIVYVSRPRKIGLLVDELKQHLLSSVRQIFMTSEHAYRATPPLNDMFKSNCRIISRASDLKCNVQTGKDQYHQHAEDTFSEVTLKNSFIDISKYSHGQMQHFPSVYQHFMTSEHAYQGRSSSNEMMKPSCKVISRVLSLEPNLETVKECQQHKKNSSPESLMKNTFTDFAKNSYGQQKYASRENNLLMDLSESAQHIVMEVESEIPDSYRVQHNIEFGQTDGELQLDLVVTAFCEKVNEQKQRITSLIGEANITDSSLNLNLAPIPCIHKEEKSAYKDFRRSQGWGFGCLSSNATDCRSSASLSPSSNRDAMDELSNLLEQCNAVQSSLDKKLVSHFREK